MSNLSKRIRRRNAYGMAATFAFSTFLGYGTGALLNESYAAAILLLALSAASFIFAITKGGKLFEAWLDRRYPLAGSR